MKKFVMYHNILSSSLKNNFLRQDGFTALCAAAYSNNTDVILVLLQKGAHVNAVSNVRPPKHNTALVILSLRIIYTMTLCFKDGNTALNCAAFAGSDASAKVLLANGATVDSLSKVSSNR